MPRAEDRVLDSSPTAWPDCMDCRAATAQAMAPQPTEVEGVRLDVSRLLVQWAVVCVVTAGLFLTFKGRDAQ